MHCSQRLRHLATLLSVIESSGNTANFKLAKVVNKTKVQKFFNSDNTRNVRNMSKSRVSNFGFHSHISVQRVSRLYFKTHGSRGVSRKPATDNRGTDSGLLFR
ncbi:hypothetical protein Pcinc_026672 [Petrolisthes cinctipes]|uniref:Uncharacterized protein n=1 Tax=Petrolisthes cinctipes TaxID=88211 RepID=A0AAE1F6F5_PETCI|nr:hypothetical protein Pcinc_026672 [Petrolisthes cinctipes]